MKKYKITFNFKTPISFIDAPTFDGILSYAYVRELFEQQGKQFVQKLSYSDKEIIDYSKMPLNMHPDGYFYASIMLFDDSKAVEDIQKWRKRWDAKHDNIADFGKNIRKIDTQRGTFKSYDVPISTKLVSQSWFVFCSDNITEVERLIKKWIHFIGKKRSQGYGEIESFTIEETEDMIARPIPKNPNEWKNVTKINFCTYKPPYWDVKKAKPCALVEIA